ncbi:MAG: hypothetical protein QXZ51_05655 [Candidatus Bathyarchaeia archaeon]
MNTEPGIAKGKITLANGQEATVTFNTHTLWVDIEDFAGGYWGTIADQLTTEEANQILALVNRARGVGRIKLLQIAEVAGFKPGFWRP